MTQKQIIGMVVAILVIILGAAVVYFFMRGGSSITPGTGTPDWSGPGLNVYSPDLPAARAADEIVDAQQVWDVVFAGIQADGVLERVGGARMEPYHAWLTFVAPPALQGKLLAHNPYMRVPCAAVHPHTNASGNPDRCYGSFGYKNTWTENGKSWILIDSSTNQVSFFEIDEPKYRSEPFEVNQ